MCWCYTRYQAGATPYLGRTFTGWIAPASPGALLLLHRSGLSPHTPCRSPGALTRVVRLSYLAPDITQAILEGRQPLGLTAEKLLAHSRLPLAWPDQRT